jgi:hypothetical protein
MEYFEERIYPGEFRCDRCFGATPHGSGYLYASPEAVAFRYDARSVKAAKDKLERLHVSGIVGDQTVVGGWVTLAPDLTGAMMLCETCAKDKGLDLEIAAADAKHLCETGQAPLRATPLEGSKEAEKEKQRWGQRSTESLSRKKWWRFWKS